MTKEAVSPVTRGWRIGLVGVVLVAAGGGLSIRILQLQILEQDFLQGQGQARIVRTERMDAHRGVITDRRGEPMAVSTLVETVVANPIKLAEAMDRLPELAAALGRSEKELKTALAKNQGRQFMYLRRHMNPDEAEKVKVLEVPGVTSRREYKRFYPVGEVAAHFVGVTNIDDQGQEGLELAYDSHLAGSPGSKKVVKDRAQRVVRTLRIVKSPEPGNELRTTMDLRIQYFAYRELKAAVRQHGASGGSVVILDVTNGDVLAMANQPSLNPNDRGSLKPGGLRNRAMTDTFEPGSTIKPFTVAAALETGRIHPATQINTSPGWLQIGRKTIRDHRDYGVLDLYGILAKSSNIGVTRLALDMKPERLRDLLRRVGLGQAPGTAFPGEQGGLLPAHRNWKPLEVATLAYGYGLSVTPLKLAEAYMVLGNQGRHRPVRIVANAPVSESKQVIDAGINAKVLAMLEGVVRQGGTGTRADVAGYRVAGKTGTVHKVGRSGYEENEYMSVFAGVVPASAPRLAAVVMINAPSGEKYYGGEVAAPVFSRVLTNALRILNVPPDATPTRIAATVSGQVGG